MEQRPDESEPAKQGKHRSADGAGNVEQRARHVAAFGEHGDVERKGRECGEAAEDAGGQEARASQAKDLA